jgi:predicted secreted Zn-dependent protease
LAAFAAPGTTLSLEPERVFAKIAPSVVIVWSLDANARKAAQGSGVVIAPGEVVTNCHVIKKASSVLIKQGGQSTKARIRFTDFERDLCQLTMDPEQSFGVQIGGVISSNELRVGQRVYTVGAPQGLELSLGEGLISQLRGTDSIDFIQTTAQISPGSSGGGLFDADGRLIGITTSSLEEGQNLNFAIPASWIFELPARFADREELARKKAADAARLAEEERNRRDADRRRREESDRLAEQLRYQAEARRLQQLARIELDSYKPRVTPRVKTSYYDVSASNSDELFREIFLNRGPLDNKGSRFAAITRWDIQWRFRHQQVGGKCEMKNVVVTIQVEHTFPNWVDIRRAPAEYAVKWQSFLGALEIFHALHQKNGNMAADEIDTKVRAIPSSRDCHTLETNANNIAGDVIKKYQAQDEELGTSTRYGETLGAKFPR